MRNLEWSGFARGAIAAAVAIAVAPVLAQNTSSAITGHITDSSGSAAAGATVTILHTESGSAVNATTDSDGRYSARGLRVGGPYTVTVTKGGQSEKREGVYLPLAETLNLDVSLGVTSITITGTGAGSDRFSRSNMGSGTNIGSRDIAAQASIARNLQDYARNDPRLSQTDKERGEISAAGQNSRFNSLTIDGVKTNDTFGLESNGLPTAKQPISIDAIQSVQVNISNYDATQKGYTGANINAVTKSGTNEFKGSLYYVFRNQDWVGARYNSTNGSYTPAPNFKESTTGFTLGGPILKDKLFFFASYEELSSSRAAPDFGPVGSAVTNVGITPSLITAVQDAAKTTYGVDLGNSDVPAGTKLKVRDTLLKLDWNINDNHRANLRYAKTAQTEPFFSNFGATTLSLSSNWYNQGKTIETLVGQWFADWTPVFSTEVKLSRRDYDSVPTANSHLPQIAFADTSVPPAGVATGTRTLFTGTERSRHDNVLRTKTNDGYAGATWTAGDHELKFGGDVSRNEIFNAFLQDTYGNYTFRCVNSSSSYTYNFTAAAVTCTDPTQVQQAIVENFQRGRPFSYQVQVPAAGKTLDDGAARWTLTETGAFVQDSWTVNKQLSLLGAVRVDTQTTGDKPAANSAAAAPMVAGDPASNTRQTGGFGLDNTATLDGARLVQPRFGFNFTLPSERKMQVRGGLGLFQGAAPTVWLSNPYSNTGVSTQILGCGGSFTACSVNGGQFSANADSPYIPTGNPPAANVDFIQKGMGQPAVWKANLAFESELPWNGIVAGAEWLHTKVKQAIYYQHLNLGAATATGVDGRSSFYSDQARNPACWNPTTGASITTGATCTGFTTRRLSNTSYNNVLLATQTDKGGGDTLTLSLQQPVRDGLSWGAAYTRSTSTEVSPLTSSVSNSNWAARASFDPNENVAANSAYLVRDRVNANLSWSQAFDGTHRTTVGVFYEGRKGKPYSWTYRNDFNGDGTSGNDLMYIPKGPGSGEVTFTGAGEAAFWQIVQAYPELNNSRGRVVQRNSAYSPFVNQFDLRFSQELPGFAVGHKAVLSFDVLNIGNFLNPGWGRIDEMAFQSGGGATRGFVNYGGQDANGHYVYNVTTLNDYTTRQVKGESQWAAQLTLKYEF